MTYTDQLQFTINLSGVPKRIISLVPSQTELLHDLGLHNEVVAVTKFCVHPDSWFRNKPRIGGTKQINIEKIKELQPDLIIGNMEENDKAQIFQLQKLYPVWMSNIKNLADAVDMIEKVGEITGKSEKAKSISRQIQASFDSMEANAEAGAYMPKTAYLVWRDPFMATGSDTFINDMMKRAGLENIFDESSERYPKFNLEELQEMRPEIILLSSEPFPFKQKHIDELQLALPEAKILLVDGEMFSWYGSRLLKTPAYLAQLSKQIFIKNPAI